jgi:hypothetical protein
VSLSVSRAAPSPKSMEARGWPKRKVYEYRRSRRVAWDDVGSKDISLLSKRSQVRQAFIFTAMRRGRGSIGAPPSAGRARQRLFAQAWARCAARRQRAARASSMNRLNRCSSLELRYAQTCSVTKPLELVAWWIFVMPTNSTRASLALTTVSTLFVARWWR